MDSFLETLGSMIRQIAAFSVTFGDTRITIYNILAALLILIVGLVISKYTQRVLSHRIFPRFNVHLQPNTHFLIMRVIGFVFLLITVLVALSVMQVRLTGLAVVFGFLSVGIGFGLQNITSNLVSGIILIFERPIRVGDRITVGETVGTVETINIRSTLVKTPDNVDVIVPNSQFIEQTVTNWTHKDKRIRIRVPVGVAYGSDTRLVRRLLLEVAAAHSDVLERPEPFVRFLQFGDSSLDFELLAWIPDALFRLDIASDLNFAIDDAFREHDVTIPFPQRDVHFFPANGTQSTVDGET